MEDCRREAEHLVPVGEGKKMGDLVVGKVEMVLDFREIGGQ